MKLKNIVISAYQAGVKRAGLEPSQSRAEEYWDDISDALIKKEKKRLKKEEKERLIIEMESILSRHRNELNYSLSKINSGLIKVKYVI